MFSLIGQVFCYIWLDYFNYLLHSAFSIHVSVDHFSRIQQPPFYGHYTGQPVLAGCTFS